jgi:hexosaminidase
LLAGQNLLMAVEPTKPSPCQIIPKPLKAEYQEGGYKLTEKTVIHVRSAKLKHTGRYLAELLGPATGLKPEITSSWFTPSGGIILKLDDSREDLGEEGYLLRCTPKGVTITATTPAGVFYGVQTLRQLLPPEIERRQKVEGREWIVPGVLVEDRPRFKWRGYLLDPARHFRPKDELKRYIDLLALHKMNILQLHLTDDQGWRVEIKKYPKLVEVGARLPNYGGKKGEGWFYSQDDIRELVAYAASRYVTIVPEIEMPGHSGAAIASYPELACGGKHPGGWSAPLCVSQDAVLRFAKDVLDEVVAIFPSPYIHVGADEVPPGAWRACSKCKPAMEKLAGEKLPVDVVPFRIKQAAAGLPYHEDIGRLQGEFVREIDQHLASKGRRMVGWDEILEGGLKTSSPAVVMAWRSATAVAGATGRRRDVIVSIYPDYYLDNDTPLQRTYGQEPIPANLPAGEEVHVLGVQANMWGEGTPSQQRVDEQSFPRLCALAETGWTTREGRDFAGFSVRLVRFLERLDILGVKYRR